jgi:lysophospholipase L1-like esterase
MARISLIVTAWIVAAGSMAAVAMGCTPDNMEVRATFFTTMKATGYQGCGSYNTREGEDEGESEDEGEGEVEGEDQREGEGEEQLEGEDTGPGIQQASLETYPGDQQALVKWSCPNQEFVSQYVLFRETDSCPDSKMRTINPANPKDGVVANKSAYTCEQIYSGAETSFVDRGLNNGQQYFYTVRGYDASNTMICRGHGACVPGNEKRSVTVVLFGESTTAPRNGVRIFGDILSGELPDFGMEPTILNEGRGGENTDQARARFKSAVLDHQPDIVTIYYGLNDAAVDVFDSATEPRVSLERFTENLRYFIAEIRNQGGVPILLTPNPMSWTTDQVRLYGKSPYKVDEPDGHNVIVRDYVAAVRTLAANEAVPIVDVFKILHNYADAHSFDAILLDGVHPNDLGHRMIADALLTVIPSIH